MIVRTVQILPLRLSLNDLVNTHKFSSNPAHFGPFKLVLGVRLCLKFIRKHLRKLVLILLILIITKLINEIWLQRVAPRIIHRTLIIIEPYPIICVNICDAFVILTIGNSLVAISLEI